jgi:hypothetical protein
MADRAAAELQHDVVAEQVEQLIIWPAWMPPDCNTGMTLRSAPQSCSKNYRAPIDLRVGRGRRCSPARLGGSPSSLPTAVPAWIWSTPIAHPLRDHAEADAMVLLPRAGCRARRDAGGIMSLARHQFDSD